MSISILATKLYVPPPRTRVVLRPRLIERLNAGLRGKLTLISAPAGFGKSTVVSEWAGACDRPLAWLSLDEGDNDPARFLMYMISALQSIEPLLGDGVLRILQAPQQPTLESILTTLLNEIADVPFDFVLVLDDYHVIDTEHIHDGLTFLLKHLPPQMHLVIATREDPRLPLAPLRARGELTELRASDLRFTPSEAAEFLNQVMGLTLSAEHVAALETRTEGWIAGLQLAAISMQGHHDTAGFVKSFTGSHHFVMDYLVEEVLQQQPESVQTFLLRTSMLDRMCGPLCDAVLLNETASGQETLEYLQHANLFIIPLDDERRWFRYHHLFADLLRQRLYHNAAASTGDANSFVSQLHIRASQWYEDNDLALEAFQHAAAANDIERAERLIDGQGISLHLRGAVTTIINWLESLPLSVLNARPSLWWRFGSLMLVVGMTTGVEEKLDAAEAALQGVELDARTRNLIGRISAARAVLALTRYQVDVMIAQSRRALEYLDPNRSSLRANANWTLGIAYLFAGERAAARHALTEAIALGQSAGDIFTTLLATCGLGMVQELDNQLYQAAETYQRVLEMAGDQPLQIVYEAHLGMARILYEWNNLELAERHGHQSLHLARQYDRVIDRFIVCELVLARIKLAQGDVDSADAIVAQSAQTVREKNFIFRVSDVAAAQVPLLLRQSNLAAAAHIAQTYNLPLSQARVHLVSGDASAALAVLEPFRQFAELKSWHDERLKAMVLQSLAYQMQGETEQALQVLSDVLLLAEAGGFIRLFIDEGVPMLQLLTEAAAQGIMPDYVEKVLAAFKLDGQKPQSGSSLLSQFLIEPLSQREIEVLQLIANGLSNQEISERLYLALDTVKGHNRRIFDKLQVQRRTEAVARAREFGLL